MDIVKFFPDMMLAIWQMSPMEPPSFITEPPSLIYFSNTTGTLINCQGQGNPQPNVTWLHFNDRIVMDIQRLRYYTRVIVSGVIIKNINHIPALVARVKVHSEINT